MADQNVVVPIVRRPRPIDRIIALTKFPDKYAKTKSERAISLREAAKRLNKTRAPTKDAQPYLKLATFGDEATAKGSLRSNANVTVIDGIEGDHDTGNMKPSEVRDQCAKAGVAVLIFPTASHTPDDPHWRALFPTSRSLPPERREALVARANGLLNGALNAESFTLSQGFKYGWVEGRPAPEVLLVDGPRAIDEANELDAGALGRDGKPYRQQQPDNSGDDDIFGEAIYEELPDWVQPALDAIPVEARDDREGCWRTIATVIYNATGGSEDGYQILDDWSDADGNCGNYDSEENRRIWNSLAGYKGKQVTLGTLHYMARQYGWQPPKRKTDPEVDFDLEDLTVAAWLKRPIPLRERLLGDVYTTTTRALLIAPTGLGKTNFALAKVINIANGDGFLHWCGYGKSRRVLFIDGEMSARVFQRRLMDAVRRAGTTPETLFAFSREDFPDMPPLNTEAGQKYIDQVIERLGGVDLIIFDNIQALIPGDLKDGESWQAVLPWARDLTRREIGQLWVHHTGLDESHGYGDSSREWQLDVVMLMEKFKDDVADIAFRLSFTKARERDPDNRADFASVIVKLVDDEWQSEAGGARVKLSPAQQAALDILVEPMSEDDWRMACIASPKVTTAATRKAKLAVFGRLYKKLAENLVSVKDGMVSRASSVTEFNDDESGYGDDNG